MTSLTPRYLDDHFDTYGWPDRGDGPMWDPALRVSVMIVGVLLFSLKKDGNSSKYLGNVSKMDMLCMKCC